MTTETKDKEERKLKKAKISLMRNPKFALWSGIMMVGKTQVIEAMPTACTNGRDELYGREFIKSLSDKELAFVVLHENLHKAFKHLTTWRKLWEEDRRLTNMACDYVINLMLVDMDPQEQFVSIPRRDGKVYGLLDRRFAKMNTKQVFDILKKEKQESGGGDGEGPDGFDEHDWDGARELSEEEKKQLERDIDQGLRQGLIAAKKAGVGAGDMDREIGELLAPKVDWREVLREFVTSICSAKDASSWRRVNRRFLSGDVYMPTLVGERVGKIVVAVDTSGSIGGDMITAFLSEVKSIADVVHPEKIDLLYWDHVVAAHEVYDDGNMGSIVESTKPRGGGGTDPRSVMNYINNTNMQPECVIILTDGEVGDNWGTEWAAPVLWVIKGNPDAMSPVGKTIHIED